MSVRITRQTIVLIMASTAILGGCGGGIGGCNESKEEIISVAPDPVAGSLAGTESVQEDEGPQYQTPTMDNLKGIEQKFPAKYPVKKYPNSRVVMAYVRPDLKPGQKNVVLLNSSDNIPAVTNYYQKQMSLDGWTLTYSNGNSAYTELIYKKGNQEIEVRVTPDPYGKRHVQLLAGPYLPIAVYNKELPADAVTVPVTDK